MQITTTYRTDDSGRGKITAKGFGKQRTVSYDPAKSAARNHGEAAATLLLEVPDNPFSTQILAKGFDAITHMGFNDGRHVFNV